MMANSYAALPATSFGSSPAMETRLAALVLAGRKRATVWNGDLSSDTAPGMRWRVMADERPAAVIETISIERRLFRDVDAAFAFEEGEGDRSLLFWRVVHEQFFREEGSFAPDMSLWCERFRLIAVLDPDLAAQVDDHVAAEERAAEQVLARYPACLSSVTAPSGR